MTLIILFVESGWHIEGAILAWLGTSILEVAIGARFSPAPLLSHARVPIGSFLRAAAPLFGASVVLLLLNGLDLILLKASGASAETAGIYAVAMNMTLMVSLIGQAAWPVLLSSINTLTTQGKTAEGRGLAREALRMTLLLLPFVALVAGTATEIVPLSLHDAFPISQITSRQVSFFPDYQPFRRLPEVTKPSPGRACDHPTVSFEHPRSTCPD